MQIEQSKIMIMLRTTNTFDQKKSISQSYVYFILFVC